MNLDQLKDIWQEQTASMEGYRLEEAELSTMLAGRSQTLLNKINRNILIEMGVVVILTLIGLFYIEINRPGVSTSELLVATLYVLISGVFYGVKYRSLNTGRLRTYSLKAALTHIVKVLKVFMNIYYWLSYALPIFVLGGGLYGLNFELEAQGKSFAEVDSGAWVMFGVTFLVFGLACIGLVRLYVKWLYGRHYNELQSCLQELNEQP